MFIIYINDISSCFAHCHFLLYADDLKIYRKVESHIDVLLVQEDLNRLSDYCTKNRLFLAYNKCKHITFTKKHDIFQSCYNLNNYELEKVTTIRDLGVILDTKLTLDLHVDLILKKAYQMLGFIMRISKPFKQKSSLIYLYNCLVRSNLEYASIAWNPFYNIYINKLEMVQKKFVRYASYKLHLPRRSYIHALPDFGMLSLQDRRSIADIIMLRNICTGDIICPQLLLSIRFRAPVKCTRSKDLFSLPKIKTNAGKRAPIYRMCNHHNMVLNEVDIFSCSRTQFKAMVKNIFSE